MVINAMKNIWMPLPTIAANNRGYFGARNTSPWISFQPKQKSGSALDSQENWSNNTCFLECVFVIVVRVVSGDILSQRSDHYHCQNARQKEHNHQWVDDAEPVNLHITHSQVSIPSTGPAQRRFLEFDWVREIQLVAGIRVNLKFELGKFISNSSVTESTEILHLEVSVHPGNCMYRLQIWFHLDPLTLFPPRIQPLDIYLWNTNGAKLITGPFQWQPKRKWCLLGVHVIW